MKHLLLFSLLFILVSSKIEKKKSLLSLAKTFLAQEEEDDDYGNACFDPTLVDAKTCKAVNKNLIPGTQCCFITGTLEGQTPEAGSCTANIKPFKPYVDIIQNNKFIPFAREVIGFSVYGPPNDQDTLEIVGKQATIDIDCSDAHLKEKELKIQEFKEDEIKILESQDHCLYEIYELFESMSGGDDEPYVKTPSVQALKCKDRPILQSSKDAGLECGTVKVTINGKGIPDELKSLSSCILFDYEMFSKIKIPKDYISQMKKEMELADGDYSFKVEISDSKGRKFVFDSNRSSFMSISKYLLILIGLLFL